MNVSQEASALLERLDPSAPLVDRHRWLMDTLAWVRGDESDPQACVARVGQLLEAARSMEDWPGRWRQWWIAFNSDVDVAPFLADHGFAPRTSFLSEFGHRLRRKLLPGTPETTDLADLFDLLLPSSFDRRWLLALDTATLNDARTLLFSDEASTPATSSRWSTVLLDGLTFCVGQIVATGFASEIRVRMDAAARRNRPFHALPPLLEALRHAVQTFGPRSAQAQAASEALRLQLDACRQAAYTVYGHLEEHGVSVGIVFRLRQLRERIVRARQLMDCLLSTRPERATAALLADLAQVGQENRSIRALVASSSHLTAAKVAERSAESGEHYITRDRQGYRDMLGKAAGGGALLGLTTWAKFLLYPLGLSAFWLGFAAGLNYAVSFVVIQLLHWTVATKQPAVTAPAMVARLRDIRQAGALKGFVDEVANLFRSQIAAILGNVGLVIPVVALISTLLYLAHGAHMIDADKARHVLHDMDVLGPSALFAAFTGVLLFASSIVAGWVENWFVFHKLDSALAHNPRFTRWLGADRAARWGRFMRANVSGLAANISLGLMLGLIPAFASFFGLGLDIRHVTLSAGQVTAAALALGPEVLHDPAFWRAVAGVAVIGPINLTVSFYLAFRLALRARGISGVNRQRIAAGLRQRLRRAPLSFVLPPRATDDERVDDLPAGEPDEQQARDEAPRHG